MTTPLDQTALDESRARFEDWFANNVPARFSARDFAWEAWQAAIASRAIPQGWQLVPVAPTDEMMGAVVSSMDEHLMGKDGAEAQYREDWAAMLRAAPTPPIAAKAAKETPQ